VANPTLVPQMPPGRRSRQARAYGDEIRRLQAQGYTLDAIRQALADAGVHVSKSTVQRESRRRALALPLASMTLVAPRAAAPPVATPPKVTSCVSASLTHTSLACPHPSGRDVAAAFVSQRSTNPLFRKGP
jgi:hypothetical protein